MMKCPPCVSILTFTSTLEVDKRQVHTVKALQCWACMFRTVSARVPRTAFNMSGFIQPALLLDLLQKTSMVLMTDISCRDWSNVWPADPSWHHYNVKGSVRHHQGCAQRPKLILHSEWRRLCSHHFMMTLSSVDNLSLMMKTDVGFPARSRVSLQELLLLFTH